MSPTAPKSESETEQLRRFNNEKSAALERAHVQNERLVTELTWAIEAIDRTDRNIIRLRQAKALLAEVKP